MEGAPVFDSTMTSLKKIPEATAGNGYVYVVGFDSGVVKAGRTSNPGRRIPTLVREGRTQGVKLTGWVVSGEHSNFFTNERLLLGRIGKMADGSMGEYFTGVDFEKASEELLKLAFIAPLVHEDEHCPEDVKWVEDHRLTCMSLILEVMRGDLILTDTNTGEPVRVGPGMYAPKTVD
jgi:hypothetical protein